MVKTKINPIEKNFCDKTIRFTTYSRKKYM